MSETTIAAPVNPLTVKLNQTIFGYVAQMFRAKWLPALDVLVTSAYRTKEHNAKVGGAANSAHVHGLAEDWQLKYKASGQALSEAQARAVYNEFIKPNWPGFSEFEGSSVGEGYHVHVQLSREISTYSGLVTVAGIGVVGFALLNKLGKG